jgi:putative redox protein
MSSTRTIALTWTEGLRFEGGAEGGPVVTIDGDGRAGPSPMQTLLLALAGCSGSDVVSILVKMRAGLSACRVEVTGTRRDEEPRRYIAVHLVYRLAGAALDEARARRAIDLSLEKYCSVMHSLAGDLAVSYDLVLE